MAFRDQELAKTSKLQARIAELEREVETTTQKLAQVEQRLKTRPTRLHATKGIALLLIGMGLGCAFWIWYQLPSGDKPEKAVAKTEPAVAVTRVLPLGTAGEGGPLFKSLPTPITTRSLATAGRERVLDIASCVEPSGQTVFAEVVFAGTGGNVVDKQIGSENGKLSVREAQCINDLVSTMRLKPFIGGSYKHRFEWVQAQE